MRTQRLNATLAGHSQRLSVACRGPCHVRTAAWFDSVSIRVDSPALHSKRVLSEPSGCSGAGNITVPGTAAYTFSIGSDDGGQLYINEVLVADNSGEPCTPCVGWDALPG